MQFDGICPWAAEVGSASPAANSLFGQGNSANLGINRKVWIPRIRRNDLANTKTLGFGCNLAHVFYWVFPLFLCWLEDGRLLQIVYATCLFERFLDSSRLTSTLNRRQVQRQTNHAAQSRQGVCGISVWVCGSISRLEGGAVRWGAQGRRGSCATICARSASAAGTSGWGGGGHRQCGRYCGNGRGSVLGLEDDGQTVVDWCRSPSRSTGESGAGRDDRIAVHAAEVGLDVKSADA